MIKLGSLFSGCGGLDLGFHLAGIELEWACERDVPAASILHRHWPAVPIARDVREVDGGFPRVDILAGGFPCQDVSSAGRRAGLVEGNRSGLWFEYARAIRILRPRVVVVENVPGLFTAGFGLVMADLAALGYDARWASLRASSVGAPMGRERVFVVATESEGAERGGEKLKGLAEAGWGAAEPGERAGEGVDWGEFAGAIRRWEGLRGPAPVPYGEGGRIEARFVEWVMGFPLGWTEGVDELGRLRMLGNAVQVQCAQLVGAVARGYVEVASPS